MKIHSLSSMPHYARHVDAIWRHLPDEFRGDQHIDPRGRYVEVPDGDVVMVGGAYDIARVGPQRVIYVEHGAGQSYNGDPSDRSYRHSNYAGGRHPRNVIGYISPRQDVADMWDRPAFAAGCPALDGTYAHRQRARKFPRKVAFTFHFDARICPESRSARGHYLDDLHTMMGHVRAQAETHGEWEPVGHAHPRDTVAKHIWRNLQIRTVDIDELLETSSVLVADNTSVMYEAAAIDLPVVTMNAPWYRRDVEHGLRFWSHVPGVMVDDAFDFCKIDLLRLLDDPNEKWQRQRVTDYTYAVDPKDPKTEAGKAAAAWVMQLLGLE